MVACAPLTPIPAEVGDKTTIQSLLESIWTCNSVYVIQVVVKKVESMLPECVRDPRKVGVVCENEV